MKTSGRRKSPSAHMQARGDTEGRDAVEGGEDMKSTKRFKAALAAVLVLVLSPLFGGVAFAEGSSATTYSGNKTAVTDPSTIWDWQGLVENDTSSVGRIWTDKTVSVNEISKNGVTVSKVNGADFVTALTALSSTSNLSDTATTPLDIVLVLDASGSMNDPMGSGDDTKRIDALKSAANSFIDEIAKQNATVKDVAKQHQVAIVKFAGNKTDKVGNGTYWSDGHEYNYSQVMKKDAGSVHQRYEKRFLIPGERHPARRRNECRCGFGACEGPEFQALRCQEGRHLLHRWHADGIQRFLSGGRLERCWVC